MKDVKHGCVSCAHYRLTMKQEPCKRCKDWSEWTDKDGHAEGQKGDSR